MNQAIYDNRISQIEDAKLVYSYKMCILKIQKDPGAFQMQREYMMLLNVTDSLSGYDITSDILTQDEIRYLFELSTLILSSDIQSIIRNTFTGKPTGWIYVSDGFIVYRN